MNAQTYLNEVFTIEKEVQAMQTTLEKLRGKKSVSLSDTPKSKANPHQIESLLVLEDMIMKRKDELIDKKVEIYKTIQTVEDSRQRTFLTYKYLNGHSTLKISQEMYLSERSVKRLAKAAYESIEAIINVGTP